MCMATNIAPCLPRVRGRGEGGRGSFDELCRLIPPRRDSGRTLLRIVSSSLQSSRENERISVGKNVFSFFRKFSRPTRIERSRVSTLTRKQGVRENILLHFSRLHEGVCKWNTVCVYKCTGWCNVTGGQFEICTHMLIRFPFWRNFSQPTTILTKKNRYNIRYNLIIGLYGG